jgi:hypothetical protein
VGIGGLGNLGVRATVGSYRIKLVMFWELLKFEAFRREFGVGWEVQAVNSD